jgi:hypothetical protein
MRNAQGGSGRISHRDIGEVQASPTDMDRPELQVFQPEFIRLGDEDIFGDHRQRKIEVGQGHSDQDDEDQPYCFFWRRFKFKVFQFYVDLKGSFRLPKFTISIIYFLIN